MPLARQPARSGRTPDRSGQLVDATFEPAEGFAIGFHERRHLLNGIEQGLLKSQLVLKALTWPGRHAIPA